MASKQVQDILIKLGIQGFEGLDKLKSSFRGLEKAIGPTDSAIQTARQSIIDFAGAGKQSIQSIQGQIDAFKGLQTQATIGGNVYRQLAGDVNRLSDTLKNLKNDYEEVGRAAKRTDAQIAAEGPARRPEAFRKQLAALKRQLDQLSVSAQTYGDKLTEITIKEIAFGRAQARQGVIAGAQAVGASLISNMQPQQQLPNTLAALQLRISELSQDFQNLDRAGQPYQDTLAEINRLQNELSRATEDGNADRKEEIRARIENYRQITAENTALREQAAIRRSVERGRARAGVGAMATVQEPARRTSALFQSVAEIGLIGTRQQTELIGKSYSDVADTIQKLSAASNGSIQSLQAQRGAWQTLRGQVNPASADFSRASKEIEQLDRRLGKLQQTQSRRMSGMQMAQAAGAAISGGIFGGPEGFLGGAIGGITGGVGGAFVGAAAGAQVGMLRQQLGGFADYAAQIQKMEIALKSAAGSQDQFNQAVAAANSVVRNLNVPQDVAIQGMTRLTAAVKGAGGQVSDAELVFKNVTSAIKATGGSAEDVDGAITAMVQVFSKGKVSAEELSGQLGERLPGAVTKFAQANEMTLPELQKALEQGQVGLNELMNFIVQLGDEYAGVAGQIASSSQDAGARLTVAFNDMRIAVGEALQPIGAEFQEAFIPFIESITPVLVDILPKIGDFALAVAKNLDVLAAAAVGAGLAMGALSVASIKVAGTAGLSALGVAMLKATAAAGALTGALKALSVTALLNPWVALAAGIAAATVAIIKHSQAQKEYNNLLDNGAGSSNELRSTQRDLEAQITAARKALEGSGNSMGATGRQAMQLKMKIAELENQLARINKTFAIRLKLEREGFEFDESGRTRYYTVAGVTYDIKTRAPVRGTQTPNEFPRLAEDGSGSSKTKKERESQLPQLQAQLAVQQQIAQINAKIRDAQLAENQFLQIRLEGERELAQIAGEIKALAFEKIPANEIEEKRKLLMLKADEARLNIALRLRQAEKQNLIEITQQSDNLAESYTTQIEDRQRLQELIATGMKEALALEYIQIENILKIEKQRLEVRKALLEAAGDVGGAQETQDLIDRLGGKETGLKDLAAGAQETEKGKLQKFIEQAEAELRDLEALAVRISQNIGNAIGNSLANGITGLIEGTTTAKEIFADFLKDVGQILIQEGAKMIATYIAIGIAKIFAGLNPGGGGGGGEVPGALGQATNTGLDTGAGNISDMLSGLAAKGAYFSGGQANFAQNSIKPFATGGIVTKPTFFKYADGGTFNNGVMGEAGPEAIMPLKRGADGKLGVAARLDGAMKRYRSTPGSAAAAAEGDAASLAAAGAATMEPIDVRYSVERINSVDYVTADQFQRGMQQAAAQGAKQGEQRALSTLKQNTNVRRSVGI
jgi:tape measure domain-containing protein